MARLANMAHRVEIESSRENTSMMKSVMPSSTPSDSRMVENPNRPLDHAGRTEGTPVAAMDHFPLLLIKMVQGALTRKGLLSLSQASA